jgi:acyl-CoA hydrolase
MTVILDPDSPDLRRFIQPGDRILCAEGPGEPQTLIRALVEQRASLGGVEVFVGLGLGSTLRPDSVDGLRMRSYGALGTTRRLADAGLLDIVPVGLGDIPAMLERGDLGFDVVLTSVAPAGDDGSHPLGLMALHVPAAIRHARTVIAEVNAQMPRTFGVSVPAARLAAMVHSDLPPLLSPTSTPDPVVDAIAAHVASVVSDGATLQLGVGAIPDAVCRHLGHHSDLGIHSGMLSDGLIDLMRRGVVTNRLKAQARGVSVVGAVLGSEDAYRFVHQNPEVRLEGVETTHRMAHHEPALVAINSALQVDVWGQVNAELVGGRYIGAIGGQPQFTRAGGRSLRGAGIIALPSSVVRATGEQISRIRDTPVERVTTSASDVDIIVTEYGIARLAGRSLAERRQALVAIAHPDFRDNLLKAI